MNLVGNAIKFTDQGEVTLRVSLDKPPCEDANNCLLHFAVSDSGIGIPLEKQQMIFDPFLRPIVPRHAGSAALAWGSPFRADCGIIGWKDLG